MERNPDYMVYNWRNVPVKMILDTRYFESLSTLLIERDDMEIFAVHRVTGKGVLVEFHNDGTPPTEFAEIDMQLRCQAVRAYLGKNKTIGADARGPIADFGGKIFDQQWQVGRFVQIMKNVNERRFRLENASEAGRAAFEALVNDYPEIFGN